jgi:D-glycero-alpha-D-manno-heptose-7-phosphate kinase
VSELHEIEHPAIKGILSYLNWDRGIEVHHDGDLPARSGLGSSSSFSAGLLNALYAIKGRRISKLDLAEKIINIEQNVMCEAVGSQDQIAAVYGGFNKIDFLRDGSFHVNPVILPRHKSDELLNHLMLFYTGQSRVAATIAKKKIENINKNYSHLSMIQESVDRAHSILTSGNNDILDFGYLMDDVWMHKRSLSDDVSNKLIDKLYTLALSGGAIGGKVLGAGGGGFMLFFVPPAKKDDVRLALNGYLEVPFNFSFMGSTVTHYDSSEIE